MREEGTGAGAGGDQQLAFGKQVSNSVSLGSPTAAGNNMEHDRDEPDFRSQVAVGKTVSVAMKNNFSPPSRSQINQ